MSKPPYLLIVYFEVADFDSIGHALVLHATEHLETNARYQAFVTFRGNIILNIGNGIKYEYWASAFTTYKNVEKSDVL